MAVHHAVFFTFKESINEDHKSKTYNDLVAMVDKIDGLTGITYGPNTSFEGMDRGYKDGFIMRFETREAHLTYHDHPDHKAAGAQLCDAVVNGVEGIFVFDFES